MGGTLFAKERLRGELPLLCGGIMSLVQDQFGLWRSYSESRSLCQLLSSGSVLLLLSKSIIFSMRRCIALYAKMPANNSRTR